MSEFMSKLAKSHTENGTASKEKCFRLPPQEIFRISATESILVQMVGGGVCGEHSSPLPLNYKIARYLNRKNNKVCWGRSWSMEYLGQKLVEQ